MREHQRVRVVFTDLAEAFDSISHSHIIKALSSQKWDLLPGVQYTNIHTEQRYCPYYIFVQIWVLGDNSTKLAHPLAESQGLYTLTKTKKLVITFWLLHHVRCLS